MKKILFLLSSLVIILTACDKKDDNNVTPGSTSNSESINISFKDGVFFPTEGNGLMILTNSINHSVSSTGQVESSVFQSGAVAQFFTNPNAGVGIDAGLVSLNSDTLFNFLNIYVSFSSNLYFYKGINWKVSGNTATGVSNIDYSMSSDTPHFSLWNVNAVYTKASGIDLAFNGGFVNADTLIVAVVSALNDEIGFSKPLSPKATGVNFSSEELVDIPSGDIYIKIRAINFNSKIFSGKKYYFANEFSRVANAQLN